MSECKWRGYVRTAKIFMCTRDMIMGTHACSDYQLEDCKVKIGGLFMGWKEQAKTEMGGKFVKFNDETPEHVITFEAAPTMRTLESTFDKGKTYPCFDFPVTEGGKSKMMGVTQKALMDLIIDEDNEESIVGRTFKIKVLGEGKNKSWKIREVKPERPQVQGELEDKAKFMGKVEEHKKKRKAKASTIDADEEGKGLVDLGSSAELVDDGQEQDE